MPDFGWNDGDVSDGDDEEQEDEPEEPQAVCSECGEDHEDFACWDDEDELRRKWLEASDDETRSAIRSRLHELDAAVPTNDDAEQTTLDGSAAGDSSQDEDTSDPDAESGAEPVADDVEEEEDSSDPSNEEPAQADVSGESDDADDSTGQGASATVDEDPFGHLATGSMDLTEARQRENRKRVMVWGPPGVGKTHNVYTAPKPLAILDTEGKAHDLADKFDVDPALVRIWPVDGYEDVRSALNEAMEWLGAWLDERNRRGTLAVDSMSQLWEWSKTHYIEKYYIEPDTTGKYEDPSDVDLKSALESNDPDWPKIKELHNDKLRRPMVQSPFHLVWTAMSAEDFKKKIEDGVDATPYKPAGEKENTYKVNYVLRIREGDNGQPVGDLRKSGATKHTFADLEWPTLPEVFDIVGSMKEAEQADRKVPKQHITDADVALIEGKPSVLRGQTSGGDGDD